MADPLRFKINDVPCRVCGAEPGEPCHRPGGNALVHGWHGGRVDDGARARGLVGPDAPGVLVDEREESIQALAAETRTPYDEEPS